MPIRFEEAIEGLSTVYFLPQNHKRSGIYIGGVQAHRFRALEDATGFDLLDEAGRVLAVESNLVSYHETPGYLIFTSGAEAGYGNQEFQLGNLEMANRAEALASPNIAP